MTFKIQDIISAMNNKKGVTRPSHFVVQITPPSSISATGYARDALFFCDTASLPGMNYSGVEVKPLGYGTAETRPTDNKFNDVTCTFMVDSRGSVFSFFHKWVALIQNFGKDTTGVQFGSGLKYGEFAYPKEYEGVVEIFHYDVAQNEVISYKLLQAFPLQIGDIQVGWEQNDTVTRLPIVFAYNNWDAKTLPESTQASDSGVLYNSSRVNYQGYSQVTQNAINQLKQGSRPSLQVLDDLYVDPAQDDR